MVMVLAVASKSTPPLSVPPSSWTWNVNEAYGLPLALAAGVNVRLLIWARCAKCRAGKATPPFLRLHTPGKVVILTAKKLFGGVSLGSVKPKLAAANV